MCFLKHQQRSMKLIYGQNLCESKIQKKLHAAGKYLKVITSVRRCWNGKHTWQSLTQILPQVKMLLKFTSKCTIFEQFNTHILACSLQISSLLFLSGSGFACLVFSFASLLMFFIYHCLQTFWPQTDFPESAERMTQ